MLVAALFVRGTKGATILGIGFTAVALNLLGLSGAREAADPVAQAAGLDAGARGGGWERVMSQLLEVFLFEFARQRPDVAVGRRRKRLHIGGVDGGLGGRRSGGAPSSISRAWRSTRVALRMHMPPAASERRPP